MSKENHTRMINNDFQKDLEDGILRSLVDLVRNSKDLYLAFRGNYLNVYYKSHSVFRVEQKKSKCYEMTFNFNHARYTKGWEKKLEDAKSLGCEYKEAKQKNGIRRTIIKKILNDDAKFWQDCSKIFIKLVDDFFCQMGNFDYFGKNPPDKRSYIEKERQQEIALANRETKNGYFIYDIEYTQARNNSAEEPSGRFDMLAVRFENSVAQAIVFVELKSTQSACNGKCDVKKHYADISEYALNKDILDKRSADAEAIINFYKKLGTVHFEGELKLSDIKTEILFIFTNKAIEHGKKIGDYIDLYEPWKIDHKQVIHTKN